MNLKAVLFDLIGTTVNEKDPNTLMACFEKAFNENGVSVDPDFLNQQRGRNKQDMIDLVIEHQKLPIGLSKTIYKAFKKNMEASIDNFIPNEDAEDIFIYLKNKKIKLGIGTGLPRDIFDKIFSNLHWKKYSFDYIGIADELGRSRPDPFMIFDMMHKIELTNCKEFLKIGDTIADIQEGKNAGVFTGIILSGTQSEAKLRKENPDFIISGLKELRSIVN